MELDISGLKRAASLLLNQAAHIHKPVGRSVSMWGVKPFCLCLFILPYGTCMTASLKGMQCSGDISVTDEVVTDSLLLSRFCICCSNCFTCLM